MDIFRYDDFTQFQVSQNKGNSIKSFVLIIRMDGFNYFLLFSSGKYGI